MNDDEYNLKKKSQLEEELFESCREINVQKTIHLLTSHSTIKPSINARTKNGATPLIISCANGSQEMIEFLLKSPDLKEHADITLKNKHGYDAFLTSVLMNRLDLIKYFLNNDSIRKKINVDIRNNKNENAIMLASRMNYMDIVHYLILEGNFIVDVDTKNWLNGNNEFSQKYQETLNIINYKEFNSNLPNLNPKPILKTKI